MRKLMIAKSEWELAYERWLNGASLNEIARQLNSTGRTVKKYFEHHFGDGSADADRYSFIRSLRQDYQDCPEVLQIAIEPCDNTKFYSNKTLRATTVRGNAKKSGNRSVEMSYRIAYYQSTAQSYDPWEQLEQQEQQHQRLRLPFVITILQSVCSLLENLGNEYEF